MTSLRTPGQTVRLAAVELTRMHWESRESEIVQWLIEAKKFSPKGAAMAARNFIDTMIFVANETGEPQFRRR